MNLKYISIITLLLLLQIVVLYIFGQLFICECGFVKIWEGVVLSVGNSQHIFDWYTFSHIIHGLIFYSILKLLFPRTSLFYRLVIALGLEISWELLENTPWVIHHYREQALAVGYNGDSILNSLSDSFAMLFGFWIAYRIPVFMTLFLILLIELGVGYMIRDGLFLNILSLLYPFQCIADWQSGVS